MTSFRDENDRDWNYLRASKSLQPYIRWEERGSDIFELVVLDGWPSKVATNRDDGSYVNSNPHRPLPTMAQPNCRQATKDLFVPHPVKPHCFKWIGRQDDTIVLLNGEKALPIRIEHAVRQDPLVAEAVVFGAGRPQLGMFIVSAGEATDLSDKEFLARVMPTIDAANSDQPAFAHIYPDMVRVLQPTTEYPRTDKDTVIRGAFYRLFKGSIEKIYEEFSEQAVGQEYFSEDELLAFLRQTISSVMGLENEYSLENENDFFSLGMDSLQALRVHSLIMKTLNTHGAQVSHNVVFEHPTLHALTKYLHSLNKGVDSPSESPADIMSQLLEKYGHFSPHIPGPLEGRGQAVLVTGITGSLGAHTVAQLVQKQDINKVYCLVRAKSKQDAERRVLESLYRRKLSAHVKSSHQKKIIALPSDLSQPSLGVESDNYERMLEDVGLVIHLAWAVNFNMGIKSFECHHIAGKSSGIRVSALLKIFSDHFKGTHALIRFCLSVRRSNPAAFYFGSSVSAVVAMSGVVGEKIEPDFSLAQPMGYAQSKLVAENICQRAAQQTGAICKVLRIGQIIGDTKFGVWNSNEAIPLMIQSATTIGALPALDESPTWVPVDTVAQTISQIVGSPSDTEAPCEVFHIVNPCTFHWSKDLLSALKVAGLQFDTVDQREWIRRLRTSNPDPVLNPPFKLLDFFTRKYDREENTLQPYFRTDLACSRSSALHGAPRLSTSLVEKFVKYWQAESWTPQDSKPVIMIVAGPCGSGKSTLTTRLSNKFQIPQLDADSLHSAEAVERMRNEQPLADEDRWGWLERVKRKSVGAATGQDGVVVACSALRRAYRDRLRDVPTDLDVRFLILETEKREELEYRLLQRKDHYMPVETARTQLETFETAQADEVDVITLEALQEEEVMVEKAYSIARLVGLYKK